MAHGPSRTDVFPPPPQAGAGQARALVIDDSATVRHVICRFLQRLGFATSEAADGVEGLARLEELGDPALLVVDWNMPRLDGLELIRRVRADARWDQIAILMVTTQAGLAEVDQALTAGAGEYVMKPFTEEMLREKLAILGLGDL